MFSPAEKRAIVLYTPFMAWTWNAAKFVLDVLPRDHPVVTSLLVAMQQATQSWQQQNNMDQFKKGSLPGFLQGSVPTADGGHIPVSAGTPFGAFGDPLGTIAGGVLPQFSGALDVMRHGIDWKGHKVKGPRGEAALLALITGIIPGFGTEQKIAKKGVAALNPFAKIGGGSSGGNSTGLPQGVLDQLGGPNLGSGLTQKQLDALGGG
jgi:hypothetical protein